MKDESETASAREGLIHPSSFILHPLYLLFPVPYSLVSFQYPEVLLLAIPVGIAYWRWGRARGVTGWLRAVLLALLVLALAGPRLNLGGRGIDVVVLADRSRSMAAAAQNNVIELIHELEHNRKAGDRVGVVAFGAKARVEQVLSDRSDFSDYTKDILPDGSDLADAISTALNLVDKNRPARILILSDGEANGPDPMSAARRAREEQVPLDFRPYDRLRGGDVAVEAVQLPESVAVREPFQFSADIYADRDAHAEVRVIRGSKVIAKRAQDLVTGRNRLVFRDVLEEGGAHNYRVEVDVPGDPLPENNSGAGVVYVDPGPRVLVLSSDGKEGNLARALRAANIPVDVAVAEQHPLSADALDRYRAVIVDNVPAAAFGRKKMERLTQFVEDLGGGLLLTGGQRSFGVGGYFKSPLDDVLPVSMELRKEDRKNRVAISIALDRSGSMAIPVGEGRTKMDLADLGTAECVRLLSSGDMVSVIAVDTVPHLIQPMTPVEDPEAIASKALGIKSMGGGIYIYVALVAAGEELMKAGDYATRHIVLFADANDSEEPGDYATLVKKYADAGITVSVIGLGTPHDHDSDLLRDIARLGHGSIMFSNDPLELPRLFTQDTMSIARNTFVTKDEKQPQGITGKMLAGARLMGEMPASGSAFPNVDGYNLCYLKPEATQAVVSTDDSQAPWAAFWYRGLGRVAALTFEVDGKFTGQFGRWKGMTEFLVTHARWLLGNARPDDVFLKVEQAGQDAVATIELDPDRSDKSRGAPPTLIVVPPGNEREAAFSPDFVWTGPDTLEARFRMDRTGTYRTLLKTGDRKFVRGAPVTLPYSPEFSPRVGLPSGLETLRQLAQVSGGKMRSNVLELLADPPRSATTISLIPWLMAASIVLLIVEIGGRRLSLWDRLSSLVSDGEPATGVAIPSRRRRLWDWRIAGLRDRRRADGVDAVKSPAVKSPAEAPAQVSPQPEPVVPQPSGDVFRQAKERARKRST